MSRFIGIVSAYAYAVSQGYTGTEEEYAELMASYATVAEEAAESAESASQSATQAGASAQTATTKASEASQSATQAGTKASQASTSATQASASATSASQSASTATAKASEASASASTASTKASEASASATTASTKASEASASATSAQTAQGLAESARDDAVDAKTDAESARDMAQQYAESIDPENIYSAYPTDTASGAVASFADGADDIPLKSCVVAIEPVQSGSGDPSPDNVRPISGWTGTQVSHSGADRTNPTTYSITLPTEAGTVYGGELDVTNGVLTVDKICVTFDGTEDYLNNYFPIVVCAKGFDGGGDYSRRNEIISNYAMCPKISFASSAANTFQFSNADTIYGVSSASELKALFAQYYANGNPMTICYPLATPITYHLTPTEIKSLLGNNNVWADAGNTTVTYRADTAKYIDKKIAEVINALS